MEFGILKYIIFENCIFYQFSRPQSSGSARVDVPECPEQPSSFPKLTYQTFKVSNYVVSRPVSTVSSFGVLEWSWNKCWSYDDKGLSQSTTGWGSERSSSTSQSSHVESVSFSLSSTHSKFQHYFAEMVCLVTEDWNQSVQEVPKRSLLPQRAFPPTNLEFH